MGQVALNFKIMDKILSLILKLWDNASKGVKVAILVMAFIAVLVYTGMQLQTEIHAFNEERDHYKVMRAKVDAMPSPEELREVVKVSKQIPVINRSTIQIKQHLKIKLDWRERKFMREWELSDQEWDHE